MKRFLFGFFIFALVFMAVGTAVGTALYLWASQDLPDYKRIADYKPPLVSTIYARDGSVMGYFYNERRFLVPLSSVPKHVSLAFLAAEDDTFYTHNGVNPVAMLRAFVRNTLAGETKEGASTITQQLVKALLLSKKREYERKIKEIILAYRLEKHLSKDEILTIYLNHVFLGGGAYGVESAARTYFGKHVSELSLAEAAIIAGLPKAPSQLNPYINPSGARGRQEYVLGRMRDLGWITKADYTAAINEPLVFKNMEDPILKSGGWYREEVRRELAQYLSEESMRKQGITLDRYGDDALMESGLQIYTAMEPKHQMAAEHALRLNLENCSKRSGWRGPITTIKTEGVASFLKANPLTQDFVEGKTWAKAIVTKIGKQGANVLLGNSQGIIEPSTMAWAKKLNIKPTGPNADRLKDHATLKPNDVVWVSLLNGQAIATPGSIDSKDVLKLALQQEPDLQSALVSIEADTGDVVALVGGYNFSPDNQFNRAVQARRQPGSAFKPIVYSAALDNGFTAATTVYDAPVVHIDQGSDTIWRPDNFDSKFLGPIPMRTALVKSKNTCTVRIAQQIGIPAVIDRAYSLGLEGKFQNVLSTCLGAIEVTPLNLTEAYTAFARGGTRVKGRMITAIKDAWGKNLAVFPPQTFDAISPQNAYIMDNMLMGVVNEGTGTRAKVLGKPIGGKTGTSNESKDAWFIGFSPYLVTGVFVGYDTPTPMGRMETGGIAATPAFVLYRQAVESAYPPDDFKRPPGIVMGSVNGVPVPFVNGTEAHSSVIGGPETPSGNDGSEDEDMYKGMF